MAEVREALSCTVRDADRGKGIVDRIRDHIKKAPPRNDWFDMNEAIEEVIEMVRAALDNSRVSGSNPSRGKLRLQFGVIVFNCNKSS